ncbi:MAG: ribonuclease P [Candidatus Aenigmarchaeota archaeon]|nr:ribonuclease P [Candidatus Aenigmarchaeota archaeon]
MTHSKPKRKHSAKPKWQQNIGRERIERLFSLAEKEFAKNPSRSHRYVSLARKIAMRYNIRLPPGLKRFYCKKCYKYLRPSINCRVRTSARQRAVIITCLECGHVMRHPYRKEKSRRKAEQQKEGGTEERRCQETPSGNKPPSISNREKSAKPASPQSHKVRFVARRSE